MTILKIKTIATTSVKESIPNYEWKGKEKSHKDHCTRMSQFLLQECYNICHILVDWPYFGDERSKWDDSSSVRKLRQRATTSVKYTFGKFGSKGH